MVLNAKGLEVKSRKKIRKTILNIFRLHHLKCTSNMMNYRVIQKRLLQNCNHKGFVSSLLTVDQTCWQSEDVNVGMTLLKLIELTPLKLFELIFHAK